MKTLQGSLVIASPHLGDPNFYHTVVLMIQHSEEGAFGVILNRPSDRMVKDVWEKVAEAPSDCEELLYVGGPVMGPVMALHTVQHLADLTILSDVYFTTEPEKLQELVGGNFQPLMVIVGYAGWAGGQIENEMETGSWFTTPATADHIFYGEEDLWQKVSKEVTDSVLFSALKIKDTPQDPTVN